MARGRLISRTLGSSEKFSSLYQKLGDLAEFGQTLFMLLVANTDDHGRFAGDAFTAKHRVVPISPRSLEDFNCALTGLHEAGLIHRYRVEGRDYLQVIDFDEHQPGLRKRTASKIPAPVNFTEIPELPAQSKRREEKGREEKQEHTAREARFERFWECYPRKVGKDAARQAFYKLAPDNDFTDRLIVAVIAHKASTQWTKDGGEFIPHPRTWLKQGRWKDELHPASAAPMPIARLTPFEAARRAGLK